MNTFIFTKIFYKMNSNIGEAGLRPVLIDMAGRRVTNPARGIYLAEVEVNGVKIYTKVML